MGVVRSVIALEDARARGALTALHGHEVLEADRDTEQRMERPQRLAALTTSGGQPDVGGIRLGQGAVTIDRQPGMKAAILGLREVEVRPGELARGQLAGPESGGHVVGVEAGEVGRHRGGP